VATAPTSAETATDRMAAEAAARAGIDVELLETPADAAAVAALFMEVWETGHEHAPISPDLLCAMARCGQYVALVRLDGAVVAGSVGFLTQDAGAGREGGLHLHSHITGVRPSVQDRRIGLALKLHQRAWAAHHGLATITWTYDPLVRRNAYFNLSKLGAVPARYIVNAYGEMADGVNAGEASDRLLVEWPVARASGPRPEPDTTGADVVLSCGPDGEPVAEAPGQGAMRVAWVPEDIVAVRKRQAPLARRWRLALRDALLAAEADGFTATTMTRGGWYVLEHHG
jgi:predicted GNAT superfamily acetyltransferase